MLANNRDESQFVTVKHADSIWMDRALELAVQGQGFVEPNPMVGCVLVKDNQVIGEGWHQSFGQNHAEVNAILAAKTDPAGASVFVTLEPCSHQGKTPPCVQALIQARVSRVVVACPDPNPSVAGQGIEQLRNAGLQVDVGLRQDKASEILAPYLKRTVTGLPWMIAKWAMTLDGKIATSTGDSQWISNEKSRAVVHQLRGRVDAIIVGAKTAVADDPLLTSRPPGARVATRIVVDSRARLSTESQLCKTASQIPTLVAAGPTADAGQLQKLRERGCEIWCGTHLDANQRLFELLQELGRRQMTNVMVEGGGELFGSLNDLNQLDEFHVFLGPKLVGGAKSISPVGGVGETRMANASDIQIKFVQQLDNDIYVRGIRKDDGIPKNAE